MAASTALELDRVALVGSGTPPEPRGILNTPGVQTDTLGTPSDWDFLVDAVGLLWTVNIEPNAVILGTAQAIAFAKFKAGTGDNSALAVPPALSGIPPYRTNAAGDRVFIGDFTQLLIGMRTAFRIEVSRTGAGAFEHLQIAIRSYVRADIYVEHPEAFVVLE
jgi:HK97 family phage major capsid protein